MLPPSPAKVVQTGVGLSAQHQAVTESNTGIRLSKSGLSPDLQWITDPWARGVLFSVKVGSIVHDVRSKFQRVQVRIPCVMRSAVHVTVKYSFSTINSSMPPFY